MASKEVRGSFCCYDSCVITDQLATGADALERELLAFPPVPANRELTPSPRAIRDVR